MHWRQASGPRPAWRPRRPNRLAWSRPAWEPSASTARDRRFLPPGTPVFAGDRIRTGADGSVGITLHDDTRLTAGPDSTLLITEFRFNPNTNEGSLLASLLKGTFSVITGLIAKHSPDNVKFKTPTMTLGIRGTEFLVDVKGEPD